MRGGFSFSIPQAEKTIKDLVLFTQAIPIMETEADSTGPSATMIKMAPPRSREGVPSYPPRFAHHALYPSNTITKNRLKPGTTASNKCNACTTLPIFFKGDVSTVYSIPSVSVLLFDFITR